MECKAKAFEKVRVSGHYRTSYYCVRCMRVFQVDDCVESVTPFAQNGDPVREREAVAKLAMFPFGSCPVFGRPTGSAQVTQVVKWKGPSRAARHFVSRHRPILDGTSSKLETACLAALNRIP